MEEQMNNCGDESSSQRVVDWKEALPVSVGESPKFPLTSTGVIGWRSTKKDCQLNIYGNDGFRKGDIIRTFNWPREGIL